MSEKSDDTRQRLLDSAGEIFAEKGFQAATIREICARAGANLAAVNYHFGDKQQLYAAVMDWVHRGFVEQSLPEFAPHTSAEEKLRRFVEYMLHRGREGRCPPWGRQLMMREMANPTSDFVRCMIQPTADLLRPILAELLPAETSREDRYLIACSIVGQCLFHHAHRAVAALMVGGGVYASFDTARLADHITRFSLAALKHSN